MGSASPVGDRAIGKINTQAVADAPFTLILNNWQKLKTK